MDQLPDHDCPGGCGRKVEHRLYACGDCWFRLPIELQRGIRRAVGLGQRGDAMRAARLWFKDNPGGTQ